MDIPSISRPLLRFYSSLTYHLATTDSLPLPHPLVAPGMLSMQLWAAFPEHVKQQGLTLEGLQRLYEQGYGDPERDYQLLLAKAADEVAAAAAAVAALDGSATKRPKLGLEQVRGRAAVAVARDWGWVAGTG